MEGNVTMENRIKIIVPDIDSSEKSVPETNVLMYDRWKSDSKTLLFF